MPRGKPSDKKRLVRDDSDSSDDDRDVTSGGSSINDDSEDHLLDLTETRPDSNRNLWTSQHNGSMLQSRAMTHGNESLGAEHDLSNGDEEESYSSSVDEGGAMLKKGRKVEQDEVLVQPGGARKGAGATRKRFDSATSSITRGSFVSLLGEERTGDNLITAPQCLMHLLKGMIGAGLLSLPYAFSLAGIVGGPLFMALISLIALVAMNFLVDASRHLCKVENKAFMDYGQLAESALRNGPLDFFRQRCYIGRVVVNVLLILTQLGFCAIYFVFLAETVDSVMTDFDVHKHYDTRLLITFFLLPVVLLCFIRNLAFLAVFSMLANILLAVGLTVIMYELFVGIPSPSELPSFGTFSNFPLFFGTAIYSVEGIGLVLPLENKMRRPEEFKAVLNGGMTFVFFLYVLFGFLGYNKYHDSIESSISYNLPDEWYCSMTKLIFGAAMYVTYALQFLVPVRILMPWVNRRFPYGTETLREYAFRIFLIMVTFIAAIAIPYLNLFIELLGSLASSSLALTLPALIFEFSLYSNPQISIVQIIVSRMFVVVLLLVGVVGGVMGTVLSFEDVVKAFEAYQATDLIPPTTWIPDSNSTTVTPTQTVSAVASESSVSPPSFQ